MRRKKVRRKKVKRGCGKRNWRRGGNALWKCKVGKKHPYGRRSKRRRATKKRRKRS